MLETRNGLDELKFLYGCYLLAQHGPLYFYVQCITTSSKDLRFFFLLAPNMYIRFFSPKAKFPFIWDITYIIFIH